MSEAQVADFEAEASFLVGIHSHGNVKISSVHSDPGVPAVPSS